MKSIKKLLRHIEKEKHNIEIIAKFLSTQKGEKFFSMLHKAPLYQLKIQYGAPKCIIAYKNNIKNINIINAAAKNINLKIRTICTKQSVPIYEGSKKLPPNLTKKEIFVIFNSKPKIPTGTAATLHAYEEDKMKKFIKKNPAPTEKQLAEDLFPEELLTGYKTKIYLHREYVRNMLCTRYGFELKRREDFYRIFDVYRNLNGLIYESEPDVLDIGYPFTKFNEHSNKEELHIKLKELLEKRKKSKKYLVGLKLYNKFGTLIEYIS